MAASRRKPVPDANAPVGYKPRLKLFLSADIVGSTAYKQPRMLGSRPKSSMSRSHRSEPPALDWASVIQGFYQQAQDSFYDHWNKVTEAPVAVGTHKRDWGPAPVFWKTVGDEVVFWKELTSDIQIWVALSCWLHTIDDLRSHLRVRNRTKLDVKCSAWVAGFPLQNKAVPNVTRTDNSRDPIHALEEYYTKLENDDLSVTGAVDFIGPGIDVGFRLGQFASSKKMAISLDCAYLMAATYPTAVEFQSHYSTRNTDRARIEDFKFFPERTGMIGQDFEKVLKIHFSGNEPLKGVMGEVRYPKFWINTMRADSLDEAKEVFFKDYRPDIDWGHILDYCDRFYDDRESYIHRPFINAADSMTLSGMPEEYPEIYAAFIKSLRS